MAFRSKIGRRADRFRHNRGRRNSTNNSKHMRRFVYVDNVTGRRSVLLDRHGDPYETRATAPIPWQARAVRRAASKAARVQRRSTEHARSTGRRSNARRSTRRPNRKASR